MNKYIIFVLLIASAIAGYTQEKSINFIEVENNNFIVKLSCKYQSNEHRELFKKTLMEHASINDVIDSRFDENIIKIECTTPKVEKYIIQTIKNLQIITK